MKQRKKMYGYKMGEYITGTQYIHAINSTYVQFIILVNFLSDYT
jgi:hypothetical protein